jgi:hypothetical protein
MKIRLIYFLIIIAIVFPLFLLQGQTISDSLITGKKYKITLFDDREVIGTVTRQDSVMVYVTAEEGIYTIKKEDIFKYSRNLIPSSFKSMFWAGGGLGILSNQGDYPYSINNKGFTFQLSAMYPFSETKGVRLDLSYSRWRGTPVEYSSYSYYTYSERSTVMYYVRADFVFGTFSTSERFKIYGLTGVGANFKDESAYTTTYYNTYDSTYHTYSYPKQSYSNILLSLGGGMGYLLTKNIGTYAEIEYNSAGYFFFFGGGYFLVKAGITYTIF